MLRQLTAGTLLLAMATVPPAAAQSAAPPSTPVAMPLPSAPPGPVVGRSRAHFDENALRYYASLGLKTRVAAEARRLAKLDPSWHLPSDIWTTRPGRTDEGPLWLLYGQDRLDELQAAIAARKATEPKWVPSEDLVAKVRAKQLRIKIMALARGEDWHAIVASFRESGIGWAQDDAEALWIIAEAYARENDSGEAYVALQTLLAHHEDPNERRATIERAMALIPMSYVEKLIAMGHADATGGSEWLPIIQDITRSRISAFLHDEPANEPSAEELLHFEEYAKTAVNPNEPALIAWYDLKKGSYPPALEWFKFVIGRGGDAMIAHGLALTLRKLDRKREAEEVAYAWREPLVNNAILYVDLLEEDFTKEQPPFIEPERVARYAQVTVATESGEGAQALAWYAYNTCQYPLALKWFEHAVAWLPKEATVYGYALALQRLKRAKEFRDTVNRYDGLFPKVVAEAFDDGRRTPPPPCESNALSPSAPPRDGVILAASQPGVDGIDRTMADTLKPPVVAKPEGTKSQGNSKSEGNSQSRGSRAQADAKPQTGGFMTPAQRKALATVAPDAAFARARVPSPDALAGGDSTVALVKKTDFPFAVSPGNPLRFSTLRTVATGDNPRGEESPAPLVARRVPGAGAMPYERFGFSLQRGWDGTAEPSSPTSAERATAAGTLWSLQVSLRNSANLQRPAITTDTTSRRGAVRTVAGSVPADRPIP